MTIGLGAALLGGGLLGQSARPRANIVSMDLSLLARPATIDPARLGAPASAEIMPPWRGAEPRALDDRISEVRRLTRFIDEQAKGVEGAGRDVDARTSFVLFDALSKLQTLAQFAAETETPESSLAGLDTAFQTGLEQIRGYLDGAALDKLTLLSGPKASSAAADLAIGKDSRSFTGAAIQTGARDEPIAGLDGSEQFTVSLTKAGETVDVTVDLSQIAGDITVDSLATHINDRIASVPALDEQGNPITSGGETVPRFTSRFEVVTDEAGDYALKVKASLLETVALQPVEADPALYVASSAADIRGRVAPSTAVARFDDTAGGLEGGFSTAVSGFDSTAAASDPGGDSATAAETAVKAVAVDSQGFVYSVGASKGDFGGQRNLAEGEDVFLTKHDSQGNLVFSRLLGAAEDAAGFAIAVDSQDNVVVAGRAEGALAQGDILSGSDSFIAKLASNGDRLFTHQLDTVAQDAALTLAVDANDDIVFAGYSDGSVDAATLSNGGRDALVVRLDGATGTRLDAALIGGAGREDGAAVAVADDGHILLAAEEDGRAVLRKLDAGDLSTVLYERDLGYLGAGGSIAGLAVDGGGIYLAGTATNAAFDAGGAAVSNPASGAGEGFLVKLTDGAGGAAADYVSFLGTEAAERVTGLVAGGDSVYLSGSTRGDLSGEGRSGSTDGFVAALDAASGTLRSVETFGQALSDSSASGIALAPKGPGAIEALGFPMGDLARIQTRDVETQTTARAGDHFAISINGGPPRRIILSAEDSLADLAKRIDRLSLRGEVSARVSDGELAISAQGSASVALIAGRDGRDLLAKLGLSERTLIGVDKLFDLDEEGSSARTNTQEAVGGIFALDIDRPFTLETRTGAKFALKAVDDAIAQVQRAFRSLTPKAPEDPLAGIGEAPAYLRTRLANYSDALQRLQAGGLAGPSLIA